MKALISNWSGLILFRLYEKLITEAHFLVVSCNEDIAKLITIS